MALDKFGAMKRVIAPLKALHVVGLLTMLPVPLMAADIDMGDAQIAGFETGVVAFLEGDLARAEAAWRPLAGAGDAAAQYNLGALYLTDQGGTDVAEAAWWFNKAAAQEHPRAQFALAQIYRGVAPASAMSVPVTPDLARYWLIKSAQLGHGPAQAALGMVYAAGDPDLGVRPDVVAAWQWLTLAADAGVAGAAPARAGLVISAEQRVVAEARAARLAPSPPQSSSIGY